MAIGIKKLIRWNTNRHNWELILEYQEFLQTEYENFQRSLFFANESYLDNSEFMHRNNTTDTQFVFKFENDTIFISFAGTESVKDLLTDLSISKKVIAYNNKESAIRVHSGAYNAYLSIRDELWTLLDNCYNDGMKIFISGHSLGGMLGLLCTLDIRYKFGGIIDRDLFLITLGQPKTGNEAFANSTNRRLKNYFRFKFGGDIVTDFPILFYSHCGKLIQLNKKSLPSFSDHKLANYLRSLIK